MEIEANTFKMQYKTKLKIKISWKILLHQLGKIQNPSELQTLFETQVPQKEKITLI